VISKIHKIIPGCLQPWACSLVRRRMEVARQGGRSSKGIGAGVLDVGQGSGGCCADNEAPVTAFDGATVRARRVRESGRAQVGRDSMARLAPFIERGRGEERAPRGEGEEADGPSRAINGGGFFPWHQWRERMGEEERIGAAVSGWRRADGCGVARRGAARVLAVVAAWPWCASARGRRCPRVGPAWQGEREESPWWRRLGGQGRGGRDGA
jgi:hypothetical protein